jgi:hypothetical protein
MLLFYKKFLKQKQKKSHKLEAVTIDPLKRLMALQKMQSIVKPLPDTTDFNFSRSTSLSSSS